MIPVEKILEAIVEQAKHGSCKTCRWCLPVERLGSADRWCEIQGNVNPIHFCQHDLDSRAYPWKTELGDWHAVSDWEEVEGCLAYQPTRESEGARPIEQIRDAELQTAAAKHRDFMVDFSKANDIYNAIKNNDLAKLTAKLNAATESMPAVLATDLATGPR